MLSCISFAPGHVLKLALTSMSSAPSPQPEPLAIVRERIVRYAASRIGSANAEDLAQEAVIVLMRKYSEVRRIEELLAIGMKTMKFMMLGHRRKMRSSGLDGAAQVEELQLPSLQPDASEILERREMADRFAAAVSKLGERCRDLIRHKLEGRTYDEIRTLMGAKTLAAVYTWDFRCREQIRGRMGGTP